MEVGKQSPARLEPGVDDKALASRLEPVTGATDGVPNLFGHRACLASLDEADDVALGIAELSERQVDARNLIGSEDGSATELFRLRQRRPHVRDLDVEGDVTVVALGAVADPAADPHAVGGGVALPLNRPVGHRVARVDFPAEELGVVALQFLPVLTYYFEMDDWLSHLVSSPLSRPVIRCSMIGLVHPSARPAVSMASGGRPMWLAAQSEYG